MSNPPMETEVAAVAAGSGAVPLKSSNKVRHWYKAAALALLNGVLLFALVNLLLYPIMVANRPEKVLTPLNRWGMDKVLKAYPGWSQEDVKTLMTEMFKRSGHEFEYEPFTTFRETPFHGRYVNVDPAGFRVSKDQAPWPPRPEAFNVFLFGGSTTFGYGVPDNQTIASYLGECGWANNSRDRLTIYNFGRGAYFSSQELILFQQLLTAGFVPQVAVFIDGLNDFAYANGEPRFAEELRRFMNGQSGSSPLENVPVIWAAHWLRHRWTKPASHKFIDYGDPAVLQVIIDRWLANKRMIELVAEGFGVRTVFVWQPTPMYKYDLHFDRFYNSDSVFGPGVRGRGGYAIMENLREHGKLGPNLLWLADMQQDRHEDLYVDAIHYSPAFSREIAGRICRFLGENYKVR